MRYFLLNMDEIVRVYVHESQTPEALGKGTTDPAAVIDYKQLKLITRVYALCHFQTRCFQAEEEKINLGGFAIGTLEELTAEESGTSFEEIKEKIKREVSRFYEGVKFPAGTLSRLGDLFVFGVDYGKDVVHECLWKGLDKQIKECDLVPLG